jgi:hypothetical protein
LGPEHSGVQLGVDPKEPLPFAAPGKDVFREEQQSEFELLGDLNRLAAVEYPDDSEVRARIKSYELAFRMQSAVPNVVDCEAETESTRTMYGLGRKETDEFGRHCLVARRLVEQGVRFVQIFHGSNGGAGSWDAHGNLKNGHAALCQQVDQPIAALIKDLKQRGMLEETMVVVGTEFGRTPGTQNSDGRDHHPFAFSVVMAGGGLKGGIAHGATDALGFHAIENRHYVTCTNWASTPDGSPSRDESAWPSTSANRSARSSRESLVAERILTRSASEGEASYGGSSLARASG